MKSQKYVPVDNSDRNAAKLSKRDVVTVKIALRNAAAFESAARALWLADRDLSQNLASRATDALMSTHEYENGDNLWCAREFTEHVVSMRKWFSRIANMQHIGTPVDENGDTLIVAACNLRDEAATFIAWCETVDERTIAARRQARADLHEKIMNTPLTQSGDAAQPIPFEKI